ncbi:MAG: hypothetical protein JNG90_04560 [Planctomycetaceae bacterium]|nr:hypothetical protein [Planctomycetaceae bacterium]
MTRRSIVAVVLGLLVAASASIFAPAPAEAAARRSYRWGGGTSRYGFYPPHRTKGMKQLGPVPALGGVRSLKGWGGER